MERSVSRFYVLLLGLTAGVVATGATTATANKPVAPPKPRLSVQWTSYQSPDFLVQGEVTYQEEKRQAEEAEAERQRQEAERVRLEAERQEAERVAAEAAAARVAQQQTAARPAPAPAPMPVTVSGQCGGASNGADRFIARESGGNPNIYNVQGSGAWGCYQIMPGTWNSSCSDLGVHGQASTQAQAACASRLPMSAWGG